MKILASIIIFAAVSFSMAFAAPNFVFVLVDDMGWTGTSEAMDDSISDSKSDFYQTPNIEKLATQGMLFSQAYSPAALCTPSRAAILTGKTPAELHMTSPGGSRVQDYQKLASPRHIRDLPSDEMTIAELLKTEGYATAHLGKWHLGGGGPGDHGFDVHDGNTGNDSPNSDSNHNPKDIYGITDRAVAFMHEQSEAGNPFYVQLSHYAVHSPTEAKDSSINAFEEATAGSRHTDSDYAAMTFDFDASLGILFSEIEELGISDNTYVIFMSDNGASGNRRKPWNKPLNGGKGTLYEGGIRVPLIVSGPNVEADRNSSEMVTGCDLLPTICELAGVQSQGDVAGKSIVSILIGDEISIERSVNPFLFHYPHYGRSPMQTPHSALIVGEYKILKDLETGKTQIFNLKEDLSESKDLSSRMPEKSAELTELLEHRLVETSAQMPSDNPNYDVNATQSRTRRSR